MRRTMAMVTMVVAVRALGVHLPSAVIIVATAIIETTGQKHATAAEHYGRDDGHGVLPPSPVRQNPRIVLVVPWKHPAAA
jgi:hypothetical protein